MTITRRLRENFSGASQLRMVDVGRFLPHEKDSPDLARVHSSLHFKEGDDLSGIGRSHGSGSCVCVCHR